MKLFGKNPVMERLRSNPQSIRKIFIQPGMREAVLLVLRRGPYEIHELTEQVRVELGRD